jgi:hypothetical protein
MDCKLGFLINWNVKLIKDGIQSALCALRGQLFPLVKPAIRKKDRSRGGEIGQLPE